MTELQKDRVQEVAFLLYACLGLESHVVLKELTCKREKVQNPVMVELKTEEDLCRSVDYILKTYGPLVEPDQAKGVGYYLYIDELCCGHPVFTIGTIAVLLLAGAKIYVEYEEREKDWFEKDVFSYQRFLMRLVKLSPDVTWLKEVNPYRRKEEMAFVKQTYPEIEHYVQLGDWVNAHTEHETAAKLDLHLHHPGAHVIVTDYQFQESVGEWGEKDEILKQFGRQCWVGLIDYEAYHADENKIEDVCVGFDYCDLFWGLKAVVDSWIAHPVPKDRITMVYFTDRAMDEVKLPEHTAEYFEVYFGENLDLQYPMYDFMQLFV